MCTIKYNPFNITVFRAISVCLWPHIQSAIHRDVVICMYKYYIVDILRIHNDELTSCRCCSVLVCCILSRSGVGLCDVLPLRWLERVGWVGFILK